MNETVQYTGHEESTTRLRFAKTTGSNPKSPCAEYFVSLTGPLSGTQLRGSIFKTDKGEYQVSVPGGRNFGGVLQVEEELAEVNGRTVVLKGEYVAEGKARMDRWESVILTAFYDYLRTNNPLHVVAF